MNHTCRHNRRVQSISAKINQISLPPDSLSLGLYVWYFVTLRGHKWKRFLCKLQQGTSLHNLLNVFSHEMFLSLQLSQLINLHLLLSQAHHMYGFLYFGDFTARAGWLHLVMQMCLGHSPFRCIDYVTALINRSLRGDTVINRLLCAVKDFFPVGL